MKNKRSYPIAIPNISNLERKYLNECIDTEFVSSVGPFVNKFEEYLVKYSGFHFASAVSSGTSALSLAQYCLGVSNNDLVIIPDYTFIATANSVSHNQAHPWLFDIKKDDLNINLEELVNEILKTCRYVQGKWIKKDTQQELKCVIPVMALGNCISSNEIDHFNNKIGIPIIIDAAGALGTDDDGDKIGKLNVYAATISFNGNKTFTCGGGGAVLTNNEDFYNDIKNISTTARNGYEYIHDKTAFNYRMTNVQAAIGCAQLERYDEFVDSKKTIFNYYKKNIDSQAIHFPTNKSSSRWLSYFIADNLSKEQIYKMYSEANEQNIFLRPFWVPMHKQPPYKDSPRSSIKISDKIYQKVITLPSSTSLQEDDLYYISNSINDILDKVND